jgi:hypothetical protein
MHRLLALAAALAALVVAVPAHAGQLPTTGTRIALLAPPSTFAANTPFYVEQGFTCEADKIGCLSGLTQFDLYIDGRLTPSATDLTFGAAGELLSKLDLTNDPSGLGAGPHVFRGEWIYLGALVLTQTVEITFS